MLHGVDPPEVHPGQIRVVARNKVPRDILEHDVLLVDQRVGVEPGAEQLPSLLFGDGPPREFIIELADTDLLVAEIPFAGDLFHKPGRMRERLGHPPELLRLVLLGTHPHVIRDHKSVHRLGGPGGPEAD